MRLVVLAALNLAIFQGVWWIVTFPPIGMLVIVLNLTLFSAWVRHRRLSRGVAAATLTGLLMATAMLAYFATTGLKPWLATSLLPALPPAAAELVPASLRGSARVWILEYVLMHGLGIAAMIVAGFAMSRAGRSRNPRSTTSDAPSS
jgi:hypothetical protein